MSELATVLQEIRRLGSELTTEKREELAAELADWLYGVAQEALESIPDATPPEAENGA